MNPAIPFLAVALVMVGLIGQGFEMRRMRKSIKTDEELNPKNVFFDKRNIKWYVIIGTGFVLWYVSGGTFSR